MRTCRDPYPFHRCPSHISSGIRPAPLIPKRSAWGILGRLVGSCIAVSIAAVALIGFFTP